MLFFFVVVFTFYSTFVFCQEVEMYYDSTVNACLVKGQKVVIGERKSNELPTLVSGKFIVFRYAKNRGDNLYIRESNGKRDTSSVSHSGSYEQLIFQLAPKGQKFELKGIELARIISWYKIEEGYYTSNVMGKIGVDNNSFIKGKKINGGWLIEALLTVKTYDDSGKNYLVRFKEKFKNCN